MHAEGRWGGEPNPTQDARVTRLMQGVTRDKKKQDRASSNARRLTHIDLTPTHLSEIRPLVMVRGAPPNDIMKYAAACVATYGLLRISELIGSAQHTDRHLAVSQITFYDREHKEVPVLGYREKQRVPARFTIRFGETKTDQAGGNTSKHIAAEPAVHALWTWMNHRSMLSQQNQAERKPASSPHLWMNPADQNPSTLKPVLMRKDSLFRFLEQWLEVIGYPDASITGKSFRRGGASALIESGAARPDVQGAGGWASASMMDVYSSEAAKLARTLKVSAGMAPAAASL